MANAKDPSYLLGQLVGTAQCLEEALRDSEHDETNRLTVAEEYFNDMIEEPASTLKLLETRLAPYSFKFSHLSKVKLLNDMKLISRLKEKYNITDEHLDEDEYFRGYQSQIKLYFDAE